jgi:phosphoglycerol transferase
MRETLDQGLIFQEQETTVVWLLTKLMPLILAVGSFLLVWYLLGCFNLNFPIDYGADTFFMSALIKRLIDNVWYFNSTYSGFPFESIWLDLPVSDTGNCIILKLLGILTHNYALTLNLYFLLGFSVTSLVSYAVLQRLRISTIYSLTGAMLFTFLPFHFMRIPHLFYTWYFNVPIFFWISFKIYANIPIFFEPGKKIWKNIKHCLILLVLACFGVYFSFFAVLMFIASGIAGSLKWESNKNIVSAFLAICVIMAGVGINIAPSIIYAYKNGRNPEVIQRFPFESETYGLKLIQMLLPQPDHRFHCLRKISKKYQSFPLVNENTTSSLGLIGSIGLIILLMVAIGTPFFRYPVDNRIQLLSFLAIVLFLFATIGGFSSIFALLISPLIRAWNRISVFIGFSSIMVFLLYIEKLLKKLVNLRFLNLVSVFSGIFLVGFGVWDQGPPNTQIYNKEHSNLIKNQFLSDHHFVQKIEQIIPKGAVYQLPYMPFPEGQPINNFQMLSYDFFRGYLHSSTLHWSLGGMKGRMGDLFFRKLAEQPLTQQIKMIKTLGFKGIYIDRRGYQDHGTDIEKKISEIVGNKIEVLSEDNNLTFVLI